MSEDRKSEVPAPIAIFTYDSIDPAEDDTAPTLDSSRGLVPRLFSPRKTEVSAEELQRKLQTFLNSMTTALQGVPALLGGYKSEEIELSLEIGAEGELGLLGTGVKASGKSGITIKLKRQP